MDASSSPLFQESHRVWFVPLLTLLPHIAILFWTYKVVVTKESLQFGYQSSLTSVSADLADIVKAEPVNRVNGLTEWGGWGIRKNLQWENGYIAKNGPAVRAYVKKNPKNYNDGHRVYVFSCEEPETVCRLLNS